MSRYGSEPTASAILALFCHLARHLQHAEKIYEELADVSVTSLAALTRPSQVNAVIQEALRLHPA